MKKILSFILACVLCFAAIPAAAFADTVSTDNLFGVILDAEGNVVEYLPMPRTDVYVNNIHVIPAGGEIITLQYTTTQDFLFGISTTDGNKNFITEPNRTFELSIQLTNTLGGGNRITHHGKPTPYYYDGLEMDLGHSIAYFAADADYKYCNGKVVNKSSSSATVRLIILRNFTYEDVGKIWY